jgi:hypothetical protein
MKSHSTMIEDRIRAAKPTAPALPPDFSARVMAGIAGQELAILPARTGRVRRRLYLAASVFILGLGILLANGAVFEVTMNGNLELLYFGSRFLGSFIALLPFDLLASAALLAGITVWLLHRGRVARVALTWLVITAYGITAAGGVALAESGVNEKLRDWIVENDADLPGVSGYYRHRAHYRIRHPGFRMGRVTEVEATAARLVTPTGEAYWITLPPGLRPSVGDHLRLGGKESGGRFMADEGQFCDPKRTMRYFHPMPMGGGGPMGRGRMEMGGRMNGRMGGGMGHHRMGDGIGNQWMGGGR